MSLVGQQVVKHGSLWCVHPRNVIEKMKFDISQKCRAINRYPWIIINSFNFHFPNYVFLLIINVSYFNLFKSNNVEIINVKENHRISIIWKSIRVWLNRVLMFIENLFSYNCSLQYLSFYFPGSSPECGVPDMTVISDIDEIGINRNLQVRYSRDQIYVSFISHNIAIHINSHHLLRLVQKLFLLLWYQKYTRWDVIKWFLKWNSLSNSTHFFFLFHLY